MIYIQKQKKKRFNKITSKFENDPGSDWPPGLSGSRSCWQSLPRRQLVMWGCWLISLLTNLRCHIPSDLNLVGHMMEAIDMTMTIFGLMGVSFSGRSTCRSRTYHGLFFQCGVWPLCSAPCCKVWHWGPQMTWTWCVPAWVSPWSPRKTTYRSPG